MSWLFYQGMSAIFSPELEVGRGSFVGHQGAKRERKKERKSAQEILS